MDAEKPMQSSNAKMHTIQHGRADVLPLGSKSGGRAKSKERMNTI